MHCKRDRELVLLTRFFSLKAPSYFSKFFEEQISDLGDGGGSVRTLYIDRDPETFRDIARHLQGLAFGSVEMVYRSC